jgi:hypothetical protein
MPPSLARMLAEHRLASPYSGETDSFSPVRRGRRWRCATSSDGASKWRRPRLDCRGFAGTTHSTLAETRDRTGRTRNLGLRCEVEGCGNPFVGQRTEYRLVGATRISTARALPGQRHRDRSSRERRDFDSNHPRDLEVVQSRLTPRSHPSSPLMRQRGRGQTYRILLGVCS